MSYNLGTVITKVQNKLDDAGFSSSILIDFANDTQRELFNSHFFQFMEDSQTFVLTPGTADIGTLPTNLQLPINLRITSPAAMSKVLQPITADEYDELYSSNAVNTQGTPSQWIPFEGSIITYPIASSAITLTMRYYKVPTEMTATTDVPEIPQEFQEVLVLGMYKRALEYNDSFDQAAYITVKMDKLIDDMARRYSPLSSKVTRMGINRRRSGFQSGVR